MNCSGNTGVIGCLFSILLAVSDYTPSSPSSSTSTPSTTPSLDSAKLLNYLDAFYINLLPYVTAAGDDALVSHLILCVVTNYHRKARRVPGVSEDTIARTEREKERGGEREGDGEIGGERGKDNESDVIHDGIDGEGVVQNRDNTRDIDGSSNKAEVEDGKSGDYGRAYVSLLFSKVQQWHTLLSRKDQDRDITMTTSTSTGTGRNIKSSSNERRTSEDHDIASRDFKDSSNSNAPLESHGGHNDDESHALELSRAVVTSIVRTWLSVTYAHTQVQL